MPPFVLYPHAALSRKVMPRPVDTEMLTAGSTLLDAAREVQAYGLAAAHLGLAEPVVVISFSEDRAERDYRILFNPEVVALSEQTEVGMEGSVSLPGIEVPVTRASWADIAFDDAMGRRQSQRVADFVARVAQHEIDQVAGLFFLRRVSAVKRDMALRKYQKIAR